MIPISQQLRQDQHVLDALFQTRTEIEIDEDLDATEIQNLVKTLERAAIKNEPKLVHLSIVSYLVDEGTMSRFANYITRSGNLKSLDLSGTSFVRESEKLLLEALFHNKTLCDLRLAHCTLIGEDIVQALQGHPNLIRLDLSYIHISHQALKLLLSKFPKLEYLDIRAEAEDRFKKTALTCRGAAQWCDALSKNTKLTHLCLKRHDLGMRAAGYLARALKKNHVLQHLDLSFNVTFGSGISQFVEGLRENTTLFDLLLNGCNIGTRGSLYLANLLEKENRGLQRLHIVHDSIDGEVFIRALRKNPDILDFEFDGEDNYPEVQNLLERNKNFKAILALVSGFHPRLGRNSIIYNLGPESADIMKIVAKFIFV